ncbi:MAG: N-6 DNA methylase [Deltaproteobacteria bacterium]|nr:N-6 DNA methylase [Deltaproteobacteria bacterium]
MFEAASKKKKKIEKDDIIPVTQIYTEHYMVEYLVQNSLGRLWMEMHPDSKLCENWAYYVKPPEENPPIERELKKAIEIKLMDPAVGSGHFHLVAFDLLLDMYKEELENTGQPGWPDVPSVQDKKDIPAAILDHNLFGIDIDARSIQLASLVLVMKARESGYEGSINHLNLVVANSAPFESDAWFQFIQNLEENGKHSVARVLAALGIQLKNLDEFGSLLRIEDEMQQIIQEEKKQWIAQAEAGKGQMNLFPELEKPKQQGLPFEQEITDETFFDRLGPVIEKELDAFYQKARQDGLAEEAIMAADGLAEEAIMAADAERGFDFARFSMQRYDVVYTNPPYMGSKNMGDRLKKFVAKAYPQGKRDLYAAFILRCIELSRQNGYVGMVTQQSWMFLRSFVNLRALPEEKLKKAKDRFQGLLRESTIETIAHLGPRAFAEISGEVVNIVLFTLRNLLPKPEHMITAYRLIGPKSSSEKANALAKRKPQDAFSVKQSAFLNITESPLAWIPMESKGPNAAGERTASLTIGHANICYVYN